MSEAAKSRKERLAKQLRANLMKRKAQARERSEDKVETNIVNAQDEHDIKTS